MVAQGWRAGRGDGRAAGCVQAPTRGSRQRQPSARPWQDRSLKRTLENGYELDDDPARVNVDAVHAFISQAYWAEGRSRAEVARLVGEAQRVVGLYKDGAQVGFCRCASDGVSFAYLADVYVLPEHR